MGDRLRLEVPARPYALSLIRLEVGGVAALTGALVTEVEDLQLATDELCLSLFGSDGVAGQLVVELEWDAEGVVVRCSLDTPTAIAPPLGEADALPEGVVDRILDALVDEHGTTTEGGRQVRWLRKRRGTTPRHP